MLNDLMITDRFEVNRVVEQLNTLANTYGYSWFIGRDGLHHCGTDHEPILSKYGGRVSFRFRVSPS